MEKCDCLFSTLLFLRQLTFHLLLQFSIPRVQPRRAFVIACVIQKFLKMDKYFRESTILGIDNLFKANYTM